MDEADSSIWQRLATIFSGKDQDSIEKAIKEARADGELDKEEGSMLLNILTLDELQVQEIMTPRTDIVSADCSSTINEIAELILSSGHSRIPLFTESLDNIIGVVHAKDLLRNILHNENIDNLAKTIMRDTFFIPETKNVLEVLHEFKAKKTHLAVIIDEYGSTSGIITIEDVLEEIVGDIEDEYDTPKQEDVLYQKNGCYFASGRTFLEDIEEQVGLSLSSEEVDTIGGYLTLLTNRVPKAGEDFLINGYKITIQSADNKQIQSIIICPPDNKLK